MSFKHQINFTKLG